MNASDLAMVEAAFETLLEVVGRECDTATWWTVQCVKVDVLAILGGEWADVAAESRMRQRCGGGEEPGPLFGEVG